MIKKLYLSILLGTLLAGCGGKSASITLSKADIAPMAIGSAGYPIPFENVAPIEMTTRKSYLDAINDARRSVQSCNGKRMGPVNPLVWNDVLYKAAYEHTNDLVESNTFSHDGSNTNSDWTATVQNLNRGSQVYKRIANNGYKIVAAGENITAGFEDKDPTKPKDTAKKAVSSWLASNSGHCENLMNPNYTEVGMAYIKNDDTKYVHYWTQNLGRPQ